MVDYREIGKIVMDRLKVPSIMRSENGCIYCQHPSKELRRRIISGGRKTIWYQCLTCGSSVGSMQKNTFQVLPQWDADLEQKYINLRTKFQEEVKKLVEFSEKKNKEEWQKKYNDHVNPSNPKWMSLRNKVIKRCNNTCEGCMNNSVHHVHHLSYAHLGDELLFELVGLCISCHAKIHPNRF